MSLTLIRQEIDRFLNTPDSEVICIMGKWGVGKTYAWNKFLQESVDKNRVKLSRYSYVSLFGQDSLDGLKHAIFENTVKLDAVRNGPTLETFKEELNQLEKGGRWIAKYLPLVPQLKEYLPGLFLTVRNQIVCLDDLERVGEGLSVKNVLGLITYLKEQRKCKVVLLLNYEELNGMDLESFTKQLEKVIDLEMQFNPTPEEAAAVGLDSNTTFAAKLMATCITLKLTNIRVIRKIERLAKRLHELLERYDRRVFDSALVSLTLFAWITYEPSISPNIDFVISYNLYSGYLNKDNSETEEEKKWMDVLRSISYSHFDEFDKILLDAVQKGYFNEDTLNGLGVTIDEKVKFEDKKMIFQKAWDAFHYSFDDNETEVLDGLYEAFKISVAAIDPGSADSTIGFLRRLGRENQADELIHIYIDTHNGPKELYVFNARPFGPLIDEKFVAAFNQKAESFRDNRKPAKVLLELSKSNGWNPEDIELLSKLTTADYVDLFKTTTGPDLVAIARKALSFRNIFNVGESEAKISAMAAEALLIIGSESRFNTERIKKYEIN